MKKQFCALAIGLCVSILSFSQDGSDATDVPEVETNNENQTPQEQNNSNNEIELNSDLHKFSIGFEKPSYNIVRSTEKEVILKMRYIALGLNADSTYVLKLEISNEETSLVSNQFEIILPQEKIANKSKDSGYIFLTLKKEENSGIDHTIVVNLEVTNLEDDTFENIAQNQKTAIKVASSNKINNLNYLAYVGTNFDLVDGIAANKLFFATNVFIPHGNEPRENPGKRKKGTDKWKYPISSGMYFSLYGNRSFSHTDTLREASNSRRTRQLNDSLYRSYTETANVKYTYASDNIGAQTNLLINLGKLSDPSRTLKVWLAPSAEFIWRRSTTNLAFNNIQLADSLDIPVPSNGIVPRSIELNDSERVANQYEWNWGGGFFVDHTNENISVRFHFAIGYSQPYSAAGISSLENQALFEKLEKDVFFSGKLWITHPGSGITLTGEVFNRLEFPTPYYAVSLSKAIAFRKLGNIFEPLSTRE